MRVKSPTLHSTRGMNIDHDIVIMIIDREKAEEEENRRRRRTAKKNLTKKI